MSTGPIDPVDASKSAARVARTRFPTLSHDAAFVDRSGRPGQLRPMNGGEAAPCKQDIAAVGDVRHRTVQVYLAAC